ncbi:MAG: chorismate synthase [Chloroflexi bacterium]|nr:chorismate synthase [Chloroflexota bacterium]
MGGFRFLTAGESHGRGLATIVDGMPAGVPVSEDYIQTDLARRQRGYGRGGRMLIERDRAEITAGVRHGLTLGSPLSLLIWNRDWETGGDPNKVPWTDVMSINPTTVPYDRITRLRPGHADTPGISKYQQDDARNILERSSARESAARVAAGAVARRLLEHLGIEIHSHVTALGGVHAAKPAAFDWAQIEESRVRCADPAAEEAMVVAIDAAREAGDSLGGVVEVIATGVPIGLGSHVQWDRKLSTRLAAAMMSVNAVKGVEFGAGFGQAELRGSQVHDVIMPLEEWPKGANGEWSRPWPRRTNNAGGLEGGMTTGEPLVVRAMIKPIATIINPLPSVNLETGEAVQAHYERSDITFVPTCGVIGEAMVAITLADAVLEKFGGDHVYETVRNWRAYMRTVGPRGG